MCAPLGGWHSAVAVGAQSRQDGTVLNQVPLQVRLANYRLARVAGCGTTKRTMVRNVLDRGRSLARRTYREAGGARLLQVLRPVRGGHHLVTGRAADGGYLRPASSLAKPGRRC